METRGNEAEYTRRITYLWGKMDRVISWEDIVQHSEIAKKKMWNVRSEEFEGSGHCEHLSYTIEVERDKKLFYTLLYYIEYNLFLYIIFIIDISKKTI